MTAAKASLADRVVLEEAFYDHATNQEFANEEGSNDAARSTRTQTQNANSGSIGKSISILINIGNEQTACNTQSVVGSHSVSLSVRRQSVSLSVS